MNDYLSFEGCVRAMEWGKSTYSILPIPTEIASAHAAPAAKRIEVEIKDDPIKPAPTKAPVFDSVFMRTGKSLLRQIGIAPGELPDVRLRKAVEGVGTPIDVLQALRTVEAPVRWEDLTPGKKRGHLHQTNAAKKAKPRAKRIAKMIAELS